MNDTNEPSSIPGMPQDTMNQPAPTVAVAGSDPVSLYQQSITTEAPQVDTFQTYPMPEEQSAQPSVAVFTQEEGKVPFWFYILFAITVCMFFGIGTLLIFSLIKGKPQESPKAQQSVQQTATIVEPTSIPTVVTPTKDPVLGALSIPQQMKNVEQLEDEIQKTDLSPIGDLLESKKIN